MQVELNSRTYILAGIIVMGLLFEVLKLWPSQQMSPIDPTLVNARPYAVSEQIIRNNTTKIPHFEPAQRTGQVAADPGVQEAKVAEFDMKAATQKWEAEQAKLIADEKAKKKAAKGWHWVWNKKLAQWQWKKKKKKKKEVATAAANETVTALTSSNAQPVAEAVPPTTSVAASSNSVATSGPVTLAGGNPQAATKTPDKFLSQQEWEQMLLKSPNSKNTQYFVQQYKNHLVTDQVFYAVVNKMLKANTVEMQQQGVLALNMTPSDDSFELLATTHATQQTSSPIYQSTQQALDQYSDIKYLNILDQVIRGNKQQPQAAALTQLGNSITKNLGSPTPNPSSQSISKKFTALIPNLTTLSQSSSPNASQANEILNRLKGLTPQQTI